MGVQIEYDELQNCRNQKKKGENNTKGLRNTFSTLKKERTYTYMYRT